MKKSTGALVVLLLLAGLSACKKDQLGKIGVSETLEINSVSTGTEYTMTVFYPDNEFPTGPVPVVYVLDGFWWGDMAGGVLHDLSQSGDIPKCIMVSIDYKKGDGPFARGIDLVYPGEGAEQPAEAGNFFNFLKTELIPQVEAKYRCDTAQRILFGHSLGGLFTLYSLLDNATNPLFTKCIAASGSLGMGVNNYVFEKEAEVATQINDLPVTLFIGSGTYVGNSPALHQEFYNRIKGRGYPNLKAGFSLYPEQHGTDAYPVFKDGIQFIFSN